MPSSRIASIGFLFPQRTSNNTSCQLSGRGLGGRPKRTFFFFAASIPSRCLIFIFLRSFSAIAPRTSIRIEFIISITQFCSEGKSVRVVGISSILTRTPIVLNSSSSRLISDLFLLRRSSSLITSVSPVRSICLFRTCLHKKNMV